MKLQKIIFYGVVLATMTLRVQAQTYPVYIGTYTHGGKSEGVYVYTLDEKTGNSTFNKSIKMSNPSFVARQGPILYAVNEDNAGKIVAYNLKTDTQISSLPTGGGSPCHIAISPKDPVLLVSNYAGGSLSLFRLAKDGALLAQDDFIQFEGGGVNKSRQESAHIHSAFFSRDGSRVFVSDLGSDLIYVYSIVQKDGTFRLQEQERIASKAGGGPRHITFSKDGKAFYLVLELTGELAVYKNTANGWKESQVLPIFAEGFSGEQGAADVKITKDGKYLYATNRGAADVVVTYSVQKDGRLISQDVQSVSGKTPRNMNFSRNEKWVFVTNQGSNRINVFQRDVNTGALKPTDKSIVVDKPVCIIP